MVSVSACSASSSKSSASIRPSTPTASGSPSPAAGPGLIVFVASTGSGQVVRVLTATGGSAHTVATLPLTANVLAAGLGKLAYQDSSDASIHVLSLTSGANRRYDTGVPSGAPDSVSILGGAFSPDGMRFAYNLDMLSGGSLRVIDLAGGGSKVLRSWGAGVPVDEPNTWTVSAIQATTVVPFSDAGPQAAVTLNPDTGADMKTSNVSDSTGPVFAATMATAATAFHTGGLGDDGDAGSAPGPPQPFNSVRVFTVGGSASLIFSKAHHANTVLAEARDGSSTLFYADTSAGAFAGISMSPDFGLFVYRGGTPVQLTGYDGSRYDAGTFLDSGQVVVARHSGDDEQLILAGPSHGASSVIDTISGGDQPAFVAFSPTS